jgi:Tol biopolymer transport system component
MNPSQARLDSWKEISQYLKRDERTVRRWELERHLPVHRTPGGKRSGVFAYPEELDQWLLQADGSDLRNGSGSLETPGPAIDSTESADEEEHGEADHARRRRSLLFVAAAVVLLCAVFGLGYRIAYSHLSARDVSIQQLTFQHGMVRAARYRPDGRNIVYAAAWRGSPLGLYETALDRPESGTISVPGLTSPQSELLAVSSSSKLALLLNPHFRHEAQTGMLALQGLYESRPETVFDSVSSADWSSDGSTLAYTIYDEKDGPSIHAYSPQRHEDHLIYPEKNSFAGWFAGVRYSPNGDLLAFERHRTDGQGYVVILNLKKKTTKTSGLYSDVAGLAWRPNGREVWFTAAPSGNLRSIRGMDTAGHERLVYAAPDQLTLQDISKTGDLLVLRNLDSSSIFIGHLHGQAETSEVAGPDWPLLGDLSNDGKQMVYQESGSAFPRPVLYIRSSGDGQIKPLGEAKLSASISPEGSAVLALTNEPCSRVVMFAPDRPSRILTRSNLCVSSVSWLPNGQKFVFVGGDREQSSRCYVQSVDGSGLKPLSIGENARCGLVSPDGKYVLAGSGSDYYKVPVDQSAPPVKADYPAHYVPIRWIAGDRIEAIEEYGVSEIDTIDIGSGEIAGRQPIQLPSDVESVSFLKIDAENDTYAFSATKRSSNLFVIKGLH